jgi:hypothetical protein
MNKYFILIFFLFGGCFSSVKEKIIRNNNPQNISFSKLDLNDDGNITKQEFNNTEYALNFQDPLLWFASIIFLIVVLSYFSNKKRCN